MRPLKNHWLVEAWERGSGQNPLGRALAILACALPERSAGDLESLGIPERDLELFRIRRITFGDALRGFLPCDLCGASLEFETLVSSLLKQMDAAQPRPAATWQTGNFLFSLRAANSTDLAAASAVAEPRAARRALFKRCTTVRRIDAAVHETEPVDWEFELAATGTFEEIHHGAEIILTLLCPSCRQNRKAELDIAQFLWAEVRSAAMTLLRDVHELARAYGWTEDAILTMNGTRRRAYLEMARS